MLDYVIIGIIGFLGLILGSFLNVVIHRLPQIAATGLRRDSNLTLWYLAWPMSFCPHCETPIPLWRNVPLLSFLLLGGRSACCQKPISWRYPLVELVGLGIVAISFAHYHSLADILLACTFLSMLLVLSVIDWRRLCLPDILTLPLLWLGLLVNLDARFALLPDAVLGAAGGYVLLFVIAGIFSSLMKRPAMGMGDFKLLAALGAWLGWQPLPLLLFMASLSGVLLALVRRILRGRVRHIPFGPCLALAAAVMLLYGEKIMLLYWTFISS